MEIVSHRGNLNGTSDNENHPDQILKTLNDFRVEVDVWFIDGKWFLGHDNPDYPIAIDFFHKNMFLHCKNFSAVENLYHTNYNWFWHENDPMTLTSRGDIWCYPNNYIKNGIVVCFETPTAIQISEVPKDIAGMCTDYPLNMKELFI